MVKYRLRCLGRPVLEADGEPLKLEMRKSLALLVFLCLADHDYTRELLSTLFWPEYDQQHAQANLRRALSSLNKSLRSELLTADREKIGLKDPTEIWVDVKEFQSVLLTAKNDPDAGDQSLIESLHFLKKADQLYRGDLLEGFNLGDCSEFNDWQIFQRESLRQEISWVLQRAAEKCKVHSDWEQAIAYTRRWVALDPCHEPAQRFLMDLYKQAGQRSAGLKQYDELVRTLQDELGQEPEPETVTLYQRIQDGGVTALSPERLGQVPKESTVRQFAEPLLKTKLYIPSSRGQKVIRQRIIHDLNQIEKYALVIVSAPAGFGKTTLLTQWASQSELPVGWYSLDNGDNDVVRFLVYLFAAFESIQAGIGFDAQSLLQTSQSSPPQLVLTHLIHDLEHLITPSVLVLDDYQFITSAAIHNAVNFLLEYLPPNLHLIIATRADPPLGLARLRLQNQLLEIRVKDLRFTSEESLEFLTKAMELPLTGDDVALLDKRIEGWVVGFQMAAIALQSRLSLWDRVEITRFIQTFSGSHRYILDYLTEEVLSHQPKTIHEFLLKTSILERLSSPVCDAVLGKWDQDVETQSPFSVSRDASTSELAFESSQQILEYLERFNLFITALDDERCWYRYHLLFADLLRARLEQVIGERGVTNLHLRASRWYEKNGLKEEAINHALAAHDYNRAAKLIEDISEITWINGEYDKLKGWIRALPEEFARSRIGLCIRYAWCLTQTGPMHEIDKWTDAVEQALERQSPDPISSHLTSWQDIQDEINIIKVVKFSLEFDYAKTLEYALPVLQKPPASNRPSALMARCHLLHGLSTAYYFLGELSRAEQCCDETIIFSKEAGFYLRYSHAVNKLSHIYRVTGRLHQSLQLLNETLDFMRQQGKQEYFPISDAYSRLCDLYYEWNDLEKAQRMISEGLRIAELNEIFYLWVGCLNAQGQLLIARKDLDGAQNILQKAAELMRKSVCWPQSHWENESYFVKLWLARGDLVSAARWSQDHQPAGLEASSFAQEAYEIARARVFIAQGLYNEAINLLDGLAKSAQAAGRNGRLIEIRVLNALALKMRGERKKALISLEQALLLAEPENYLRVFLDEGEAMRLLIQEIQIQEKRYKSKSVLKTGLSEYISHLLAAFRETGRPND